MSAVRGKPRPAAVRATAARHESLCVTMVCTDSNEAEQVGRCIAELNMGCLVTYRRTQDLISSAPAGQVALVILAAKESAPAFRRALSWLRRRWPRSAFAVLGDAGGGEEEMAARQGGAMYLTRPVPDEQWTQLLAHVGRGARKTRPTETVL